MSLWFITSKVPGTKQIRVSWSVDGKPHTRTFESDGAAQAWIAEQHENERKNKST